MPTFQYIPLDVFTDRLFGGNQLAVFPDARGIPDAMLQDIAREFNYSETTFCYPPANPAHEARVRIFTPGAEVPFAGHPTIGTAIALHARPVVNRQLPPASNLDLVARSDDVIGRRGGPILGREARRGIPEQVKSKKGKVSAG